MKEIIKGYGLKCDCCNDLMVCTEEREDGTERAVYRVFLSKVDAEKEAKDFGAEVKEVQIAL